jgi:hypothetical protein
MYLKYKPKTNFNHLAKDYETTNQEDKKTWRFISKKLLRA